MRHLLRDTLNLLHQGESIVLATIVDSHGSTPRSSGAKMTVRRPGLPGESILGTVGGGITEAMAIRDAGELFGTPPGTALLRELDLNRDLAAGTDMICGGQFSLLLEHVSPNSPATSALEELDRLLRQGRPGLLFFQLAPKDQGTFSAQGHAVTPLSDAPPAHAADVPDSIRRSLVQLAMDKGAVGLHTLEDQRYVAEPAFPPAPVFLYGAGHVSRCTARLAAMMGFRTVVLDDRQDFANAERFPEADQIVVLDDFHQAVHPETVGKDAFVVILTRGHAHDKTVLGQALRTPARYIGMIGSKKKRGDVYAALRKEGFTDQDLDRCHCPIGVTMNAQTPEEIALSIVAQLVDVRGAGNEKH
ncbi:MAG: XdhC family aldehyde oxidoreductase maturation factor [Desulfovibrio sp.]